MLCCGVEKTKQELELEEQMLSAKVKYEQARKEQKQLKKKKRREQFTSQKAAGQRVISMKLVIIIPCVFVIVAMGILGILLLTKKIKHGDFIFTRTGKGYSVALMSNVDKSMVTNVTIPEEINNRPVVAIASKGFKNCTSLRTVVIPNSVKKIGAEAFKGSTSLSSVLIPENVGKIGEQAFYGCTYLSIVYIAKPQPETVTLGKDIFSDTPLSRGAAGSAMYFATESAREFYRQAFDWSVMPTNEFMVPAEYDEVVRHYSETGTYLNEYLNQVMRQRAVDFSVEIGASVKAAMNGTIISLEDTTDPYFETVITIQHTGGIISKYSFKSGNNRLTVGGTVAKGEALGEVAGAIPIFPNDGPMLRFEMTMGGRAVNPAHFAPIL